ncbi:MAG: glycine--tRNA ligase subunit beta [Azospira oryzae]|nr:MAG: glycine--tRNA ligase subunit beta [Azospira oryzae]PZP83098.1 MAG: glycine--tRNA ligase subunit beta [Azospira oryzae]
MTETLLVEILTEELPPKALRALGAAFADGLTRRLGALDLLEPESRPTGYATPRRLAVTISRVREKGPDKKVEVKGPYVTTALDRSGKPTPALEGFCRKHGIDPTALVRAADAKGEYFVCRLSERGNSLEAVLAQAVEEALRDLPVPKMMRWGAGEEEFVRPVHGVVLLHGARVVEGTVMGLPSGRVTRGHRFLGESVLEIPHAEAYAERLAARGYVVASFDERRSRIEALLKAAADGLNPDMDDALLDEVTALVEYPVVYVGNFDPAFLAVPQECLILSMKQHQKYFPLLDPGTGRLQPRFLIVSNLQVDDASEIVHGNERVLRARLADAKFFYDQDRKSRLDARVPRLADVVYHNRLGSQLERVLRIQKLAGMIAAQLHADHRLAERAAYLSKADLLTDMVGEFPELQGIMGMHYARHDGEPEAVARAIEAHYHPRFANDTLPEDDVSIAVALADKLDSLVGIFGIGLAPTGDKDPYALRRHALGVLRILIERSLPLDLKHLLAAAHGQFPPERLASSVVADVFEFMLERLRHYLRGQGYGAGEVEAVVSQQPSRIDRVVPRIQAVQAFRRLPEAESLAAANKRIQNILKKADAEAAQPNPSLMQEPAEKQLHQATGELMPRVRSLIENGDYTRALCTLAQVKPHVDAFFDQVLVMTEEPLIRANRLALLRYLASMMNQVADISKLAS